MATSPYAYPLGVPYRASDASGAPLSGGLLYTYVAGTSTPLATYPTYADGLAGTNPNANPVVLASDGTAQVWVQATAYKLIQQTSGGATLFTMDNVNVAGGYPTPYPTEWVQETATGGVSFVSGTSFTVNGIDATATYHIGRRVRTTNTGGTRYATVTASSFATNTSVTVQMDSGTLDAGLSAVYYGWNSYSNPSYLSPRTAFSAIKNGNQTGFAASSKVTTWTVQTDNLSEWDTGNNRWTPRYTGLYLVTFQCEFADTGTTIAVTPQISVGGSVVSQAASRSPATASNIDARSVSYLASLSAASGFVEAFLLGTANTTVQGTAGTRLTVSRIA